MRQVGPGGLKSERVLPRAMRCRTRFLLLLVLLVSAPAGAQQADRADRIVGLEEIRVVGSRSAGRSAADSPVPVDVIDGDSLKSYGTTDMNDLLSATVPVLQGLSVRHRC